MMKIDTYMPFFADKFFAAVAGQDDMTIVAYLKFICHYRNHLHCKGLPDDDSYLRRISGTDMKDWGRLKKTIFDNDRFFKLEDGVWHQKFTRAEFNKSLEIYEAQEERAEIARKALAEKRLRESKVSSNVSPDISSTGTSLSISPSISSSDSQKNGAEIPSLEQCREYAQNPQCGFPASLVQEFYDRQCDRGWGQDWRARMRAAVATYREMEFKRKIVNRRAGANVHKGQKPRPPESPPKQLPKMNIVVNPSGSMRDALTAINPDLTKELPK